MEEYKEKVFTIRDINGNIKEGGTIEDCLPQDYVENKIRNIQDGEINFSLFKIDDSPYIEQLKLFINKEYKDKDKKEKINFIIENFKKDISDDFNPTKKFFESNLLLKELCENIITKI